MNYRALILASAVGLAMVACGDNNPPAPTATKSSTAPATTVSVDALKKTADQYLQDLSTYIKDNKWDLADKAVAKLDDMRAKLPAEYGPKIDQIKQALATAKAAAAKLPTSPPVVR